VYLCIHSSRCEYDYIVIGSGAAGSVLASELHKAGYRVIVLEAGGDYNCLPLLKKATEIQNLVLNQEPAFDWREVTEYQDNIQKQLTWAGGRVYGGGPAINGTFWLEGTPDIYETIGIKGAHLEKIRQFLRTELEIEANTVASPVGMKCCKAINQASNIPIVNNYNEYKFACSPYIQVTQKNGKRTVGSKVFLSGKVQTLLHCTALKVKPHSVKVLHKGIPKQIRAKHEIILSAGIHSNQILQLSGIKNAGSNAIDAVGIEVFFTMPPTDNTPSDPNAPAAFYAYLPGSSGQRDFHFVGKANIIPGLLTVGVVLIRTESRGEAQITTKDPLTQAEVNLNVLGDESDMQAMMYGIRTHLIPMALALFAIDNNYILLAPDAPTVNDDAALRKFILANVNSTVHNFAGTCSQVVDLKTGKVKCLPGVRVADASILPVPTNGGTMETAYVIGKYISERILC